MRAYYMRKLMAKRRLLKRRMLTLRVTVPVLDKLTRYARLDGKDRAEYVRELIEQDAEAREKAEREAADRIDRMARNDAEQRAA